MQLQDEKRSRDFFDLFSDKWFKRFCEAEKLWGPDWRETRARAAQPNVMESTHIMPYDTTDDLVGQDKVLYEEKYDTKMKVSHFIASGHLVETYFIFYIFRKYRTGSITRVKPSEALTEVSPCRQFLLSSVLLLQLVKLGREPEGISVQSSSCNIIQTR